MRFVAALWAWWKRPTTAEEEEAPPYPLTYDEWAAIRQHLASEQAAVVLQKPVRATQPAVTADQLLAVN